MSRCIKFSWVLYSSKLHNECPARIQVHVAPKRHEAIQNTINPSAADAALLCTAARREVAVGKNVCPHTNATGEKLNQRPSPPLGNRSPRHDWRPVLTDTVRTVPH